MKLTLLDIVQDILSDMNSDEVNSIGDTIESLQVAHIVKSCFFEMIGNKNWPHLHTLSSLRQVGDSDKPTHMRVEDEVKELKSVEYNISEVHGEFKFREVCYLEPDDFLRKTNQLNPKSESTIPITDYSGVEFNIKDNAMPRYYTSFDDERVVFDSYDKEFDDTIQESKNRISVVQSPTWRMDDTHVPFLPAEAFPALLAEAKSTCFARIKQMNDGKAEQQSRRQRNWLSRKAFNVAGGIRLPDYSRKR